jgi:methylated-DNA-protein-cysteine methyltransferase-like protein
MESLWEIIRSIPYGKVASYGDVGQALRNPVSGLIVGRWMTRCEEDIPWWRVVGANGTLLIAKRDPVAAEVQMQRLKEEGVAFIDLAVDMENFRYYP